MLVCRVMRLLTSVDPSKRPAERKVDVNTYLPFQSVRLLPKPMRSLEQSEMGAPLSASMELLLNWPTPSRTTHKIVPNFYKTDVLTSACDTNTDD